MAESLQAIAARLQRHDLDGAERGLRHWLSRAPHDPEAHNLLGLVRLERRELAPALQSFSEAMRLRVPYPEAAINASVACNRAGEHELAKSLCEVALDSRPNDPAALLNLGMACKGLRQLADARRAFSSVGQHPMALFNLGHTLLLENDLEHGLALCEARRAVLDTGAALAGPAWDGAARPDARLLVVPEQGLGDVLLMSRFLPALADRFAQVVVLSPAPLARLLAGLDARLRVVADARSAPWDCWAPVMSLPWLLGIRRIEDVPTAPWIRVGPSQDRGERPRVGLNWAGNPSYAYDHVRSTSLDALSPLLGIDAVEWVSLHRGVREHEAVAHGLAQPLLAARDLLDTAGVIAGLDLVISTETAIPNLSAAMGVPTCVLSVRDVDWRWASWYEGVTVCAQQAPGNWYGPMAAAGAEIQRLLAPDQRTARAA